MQVLQRLHQHPIATTLPAAATAAPMVADALLRELATLTKGFAAPAISVAAAQQLLTFVAELCDCMGADKQEHIRQLSDASQADLTGWVLACRVLCFPDAPLAGSAPGAAP